MTTSSPIDPIFLKAAEGVMARCDELGGISDEPRRITRTFLSRATKQTHDLVTTWMQKAGLSVRVDSAGNLIGRRDAGHPGATAKTFVIGSHLDTVPDAGKYDGILGVLAGIAIAELIRSIELPFALEIVGFSEEEGVRFGKPYIGSQAYAGTLDAAWLTLQDKNGVAVADAIQSFGLDPSPLMSLTARIGLLGYLELHIEQGPVLESMNLPLGVVSGIAAQTRFTVELMGNAGHAGTTPMGGLRRDALAGAAEIIGAIERLALESKGKSVATVGMLEVLPNASNVIPDRVCFSVDARAAIAADRDGLVTGIVAATKEAAERRHLKCVIANRSDFAGTAMNRTLQDELSAAVKMVTQGAVPVLSSGAGHDAAVIAGVAPVAMLFLRNAGGISHTPAESVAKEDVAVALAAVVAYFKALAEAIQNGGRII